MSQGQIIAMGGGGFTMEPGNPLLDEYILSQAPVKNPRICFLPTASGDNDAYIRRFYETFSVYECQPSYLSLFRLPPEGLEAKLMASDVIYVGGGNSVSLLALWQGWGMDDLLR
jgi:peptidase E